MIIKRVGKHQEVFSNYELEGKILSIAGIPLDLEAEQRDQEVSISFSRHNGKVQRGMMACCEYVAEVIIPPRKYQTVEVVDTKTDDTTEGEGGETEPRTHTKQVPLDFDFDTVVVYLWPIR
jgi:hypothetical protein